MQLPAFVNRLRWSRLSKAEKKVVLAAGGISVLGTIIYAATRKKEQTIAEALALAPAATGGMSFQTQLALKDAIERLAVNLGAITQGNVIFMQDAQAMRRIIVYQGVKGLETTVGAFYRSGHFSTDDLANQTWCQTIAAQIENLHSDWLWPFYHTVYREPDYVQPQTGVHYAGNPIPVDDPRWEAARQASEDVSVGRTMHAMDFGDAIDVYHRITNPKAPSMGSLYVMQMPIETRDALARFARDLAAKNGKTLPTTDGNGKPIPEPQLTIIHASVGALIASQTIDLLEGPNSPCIRKLDAGMIFQMFSATIGTVLGLAFGPALSGISVAITIASTINKLANIGK